MFYVERCHALWEVASWYLRLSFICCIVRVVMFYAAGWKLVFDSCLYDTGCELVFDSCLYDTGCELVFESCLMLQVESWYLIVVFMIQVVSWYLIVVLCCRLRVCIWELSYAAGWELVFESCLILQVESWYLRVVFMLQVVSCHILSCWSQVDI